MSSGTTLRSLQRELIPAAPHASSSGTLVDAERAYILAALEGTRWTVGGRGGAAARLGLPRTTLIAKMQKLGITRTPQQPGAQTGHGKVYQFPANGGGRVESGEVDAALPLASARASA